LETIKNSIMNKSKSFEMILNFENCSNSVMLII
jgi:hypothetical protein